MDTSETYIKMSDCPEIQDADGEGKHWDEGDVYYGIIYLTKGGG